MNIFGIVALYAIAFAFYLTGIGKYTDREGFKVVGSWLSLIGIGSGIIWCCFIAWRFYFVTEDVQEIISGSVFNVDNYGVSVMCIATGLGIVLILSGLFTNSTLNSEIAVDACKMIGINNAVVIILINILILVSFSFYIKMNIDVLATIKNGLVSNKITMVSGAFKKTKKQYMIADELFVLNISLFPIQSECFTLLGQINDGRMLEVYYFPYSRFQTNIITKIKILPVVD